MQWKLQIGRHGAIPLGGMFVSIRHHIRWTHLEGLPFIRPKRQIEMPSKFANGHRHFAKISQSMKLRMVPKVIEYHSVQLARKLVQ